MAYYVIKNGGTAGASDLGRSATLPTGSFTARGAANYYNDILDTLANASTAPVAGDIFLISDLHLFDNGGASIVYVFPTSGVPLQLVSVDDTDMTISKVGAKELTTSNIRFQGKSTSHGITFETSNSVGPDANNSQAYYENCTLRLITSNDQLDAGADGVMMNLVNSTVHCEATSNGITISGGSRFKMVGGSWTAATTVNDLLRASALNGGGNIECIGVDLSVIDGSLLGNTGGSQTFDDNCYMRIDKCKLNASVLPVEETITNPEIKILITNSASASAIAEHQYYYEDYWGSAQDQDDTGVHRDESLAFPSGTKISINATSSANVSPLSPLIIDFPARYAELSVATTDTIRIFFASTTASLTDNDVWVDVIYPDGTNQHEYQLITNKNANSLGAGTVHTDDSASSTWKSGALDLTGHSEYRMDIATVSGADSVPIIKLYIGKPSITIFFDTSLDLVA